ncbi:MAG: hypothetical protein NTW94_01500 [Legionellales bacterium]|nr:hypothetical protein [Legionellales bacterium]
MTKQAHLLLERKQHAVLNAVALAFLPYTLWLSAAIIALVTLRKGVRAGGFLLGIVGSASFGLSLISTSASIALVNVLTTFLPCFIAASVLRMTVSWRAVAGVCLLQVLFVALLLQILMPDLVMAQYLYLQAALREVQADSSLLTYIVDKIGSDQMLIASYFLGLQSVGVIFSALLSLMSARSMQSFLFFPGEFRREMLSFRAEKIGLGLWVILIYAASQHSLIAASILPLFMLYFMLAGLSLILTVFGKQKSLILIPILLLTFLFLPFIMLPIYVLFGSLDSLINFRMYLPSDAGKTI